MKKLRPDRKARFKAALALRGMGMEQWAKSEGVTRQHLNATLNDPTESAALVEKIDAFILDTDVRMTA